MKISFLSSDLSVVDVTRGLWLWRRRASIQLVDTGNVQDNGLPVMAWRYVSSGTDVEWDLARDIERAQTRERMRKQLEDDAGTSSTGNEYANHATRRRRG